MKLFILAASASCAAARRGVFCVYRIVFLMDHARISQSLTGNNRCCISRGIAPVVMKLPLIILLLFSSGSLCVHSDKQYFHWASGSTITCPCHTSESSAYENNITLSRKSHGCSCVDSTIAFFDATKRTSKCREDHAALPPLYPISFVNKIAPNYIRKSLSHCADKGGRNRVVVLLI